MSLPNRAASWPLCLHGTNPRSNAMKILAQLILSYLLTVMTVSGAGYLLTLPWSAP